MKQKKEKESWKMKKIIKTEEFISNLGKNKEHSYLKNLKNPRKQVPGTSITYLPFDRIKVEII